MRTCQIYKLHHGIECQKEAGYSEPDGIELCVLHSRNKEKDRTVFEDEIKKKLNEQDFDFSGIYFHKSIDFRINFKGFVQFSRAEFASLANFRGATFEGDGEVYFDEVKFNGLVNFSNALFYNKVDFSFAEFHHDAKFNSVKFYNDVSFYYSKFLFSADYSKAEFLKKDATILFCNSQLNGSTLFKDTVFFGIPDFRESKISNVDFSGTEFLLGAQFTETEFLEGLHFFECFFCKNGGTVFFDRSKFVGIVKFYNTKFLGPTFFRNSEVEGEVRFENINPENQDFHVKFIDLKIYPDSILEMKNTSLINAQFEDTDVRKIKFHNVNWCSYHGRKAIYDEIYQAKKRLESVENFAKVEELYRYLKINYENNGDLKNAGDFHYGEMEIHRKSSPWRRYFSWYAVYWVLSGYGERPLRALFVLAGLILILPAIVWSLGTEGYLNTLLFFIEKATLQRPAWPQGITWGGKLWSTLSVIFIPGQAALFLLALRNRLGRRR